MAGYRATSRSWPSGRAWPDASARLPRSREDEPDRDDRRRPRCLARCDRLARLPVADHAAGRHVVMWAVFGLIVDSEEAGDGAGGGHQTPRPTRSGAELA